MATDTLPEQDLQFAAEVTIKAAKGKQPRLEVLAYDGGILDLPAGPVVVDLAGIELPQTLRILSDHQNNVDAIVGEATPKSDGKQIIAVGTIAASGVAGKRILDLHHGGVQFEASIGAKASQFEKVHPGDSITVNGREITSDRGFVVARKSKLKEISIVGMGAGVGTEVSIAAKAKGNRKMPDTITETETENETRIEQIEAMCQGQFGIRQGEVSELRIRAIAGDIEIEALQENLLTHLRQSRTAPPQNDGRGQGGGRGGADDSQILEASLCMSSGISEDTVGKWYDDPTMMEALSAKHRGASLHSAFSAVMVAAGRPPISGRLTNDSIRAAYEADRMLQASGFSTISLPGILGNVANKAMLSAYEAVATTWQLFCAVAANSDFKSHERYRLVGSGEFEKVGADGELKHIGLDEQKYTSQLDTFGALISLTRQMQINDDLDAMMQVPRIIGRMSVIKLEKVIYTLLLSNPSSFFSAANNNYFEGGSTNLQISSLETADQKFEDQTDGNGDPVLITPSILLVPTDLKITARSLVRDTTVAVTTTTDLKTPDANPFAGAFTPAASPWLNSQNLTGSSALAWYLLGGPSDTAIMEVAFLNGAAVPVIESGDTSFETLGMQWRGFWDFAVAMRDTRGGVFSKGEA